MSQCTNNLLFINFTITKIWSINILPNNFEEVWSYLNNYFFISLPIKFPNYIFWQHTIVFIRYYILFNDFAMKYYLYRIWKFNIILYIFIFLSIIVLHSSLSAFIFLPPRKIDSMPVCLFYVHVHGVDISLHGAASSLHRGK